MSNCINSRAKKAIGISTMSGMLLSTVVGIVFGPALCAFFQRLREKAGALRCSCHLLVAASVLTTAFCASAAVTTENKELAVGESYTASANYSSTRYWKAVVTSGSECVDINPTTASSQAKSFSTTITGKSVGVATVSIYYSRYSSFSPKTESKRITVTVLSSLPELVGEGLRISEICPKPLRTCPTDSTKQTDGVDPNGVVSGWIELVNAGSGAVDLGEYKLVTANRGKKLKAADFGRLPTKSVAPGERVLVYTTEGYAKGDDLMFAKPLMTEKQAHYFKAGESVGITADAIVLAAKVNPKKFPMVRLLKGDAVIDSVIIPADLPDDASVVVQDPSEDGATFRYLSTNPTLGAQNKIATSYVKLGPNVGPLYGVKHSLSDLDPVPPAVAGQDYPISLDVNPVDADNPNDAIRSVTLLFRTNVNEAACERLTMSVAGSDSAHGAIWTASVPSEKLPAKGMLLQWKAEIVDAAGNTWLSPAFNGKDAGYEWYGTIVDPGIGDGDGQNSATIPTWHMFVIEGNTSNPMADLPSKEATRGNRCMMNLDYDEVFENPMTMPGNATWAKLYPHGARCAIYDMQTSNYYDNVLIDCRGNSSGNYYKRSHGLKFSKIKTYRLAQPYVHPASGIEVDSIAKTSLCAEYNDPAYFRQRLSFWLLNQVGVHAPWENPKRVNLNGKFYQFAYESPRFGGELLCDIYGFDPRGYGYKNVGSLHQWDKDDYGYTMGTTADAGTKMAIPDDGNEKDFTELLNLFGEIADAANVKDSARYPDDITGLDNETLTRKVVEKFDLPAWINYLAATRITQEGDDAWGNLSAYYDRAVLLDGTCRGNGTWRPIAWDLNCSWGQFYQCHIDEEKTNGLHADRDWNKCHPFYGGMRILGYKTSAASASFYGANGANFGFESVFQSTKFRRLFVRRLRTLMDDYLKDVGTEETATPIACEMAAYRDEIQAECGRDRSLWGHLLTNSGNRQGDYVCCWDNALVSAGGRQPDDPERAYTDIWNNYLLPRREHLFLTHSADDPNGKGIGYGLKLCAGIPNRQSDVATLKDKITAEYVKAIGAVVLRNANAETIDMSGWRLTGPVSMTLPPGTVIDSAQSGKDGEVYVTADRLSTIAKMTLTDQVVVGNGVAKPNSRSITLTTDKGENIDGAFTEFIDVVPVLGEGEDEPGAGEVRAGAVSRFDASALYDGLSHTIDTNGLVKATALARQSVAGLTIEYAVGAAGDDEPPSEGWRQDAPSFTDEGTYLVWYRISAPKYASFVHAAKVTVKVIRVVINEVQSSNDQTLLDEYGEDLDWIELYNQADKAADLSGCGLSDKASKPYKWVFPENTTIAPHGYLIVFAGGTAKKGTQLHSSLSLGASGETLTLTDPSGVAVDSLTFGALPADTSFGRKTRDDGSVENRWFAVPTPGAANDTADYGAPLGPVKFSQNRGVFVGATNFTVTLSHADSSAKIWYTLDHSDPSPTNKAAVLYGSAGIPVSKTTIVRATAVRDGHLPYRNIVTHSYIYLDRIVDQEKPEIAPTSWTDLKKDSTTQQGSCKASYTVSTKSVLTNAAAKAQFLEALGKAPVMSITLSDGDLFDPKTGVYCKPVSLEGLKKAASVEWVTGNHVFCTDAGLCAHGGASRHFEYSPKKSFGLKFRGRYGASKLDRPVMDDIGYACDEFKSLVLRAESNHSWTHIDDPTKGTNMHDQFLRDVFGAMSGVQPHGNQVHLFLNGLYWGLYNVTEALDDHFAAARWGGENEEYDVIVGDRHDDTGMEVRDGGNADYISLVSELKALAKTDVRRMYETACEKIDLDTMIDYMLIEWYICNTDWPQKNWTAMMSVSRGVPLRYVAWDLDQSMMDVSANRVSFDTVAKYPTTTNSVQVVQRTLENSPEYRLRFADHIHRHFYNDGAMTSSALIDRYRTMATRIRPMVFAEVARWGAYRKDYEGKALYDLATWDAEYRRLTQTYFPKRWDKFKTQLVTQGLYPSVEAAEFAVAENRDSATLSVPSGATVYYTTDGSDPRVAFTGKVAETARAYVKDSVIAATDEDIVVRARAYNAATGEWSAISEAALEFPLPVINKFLPQGNGESWDVDSNWACRRYPNAAGELAVIGIPNAVKKGKNWRNIHINASDVTVGEIRVTNGGWTNRLDSGVAGGSLVLCGAASASAKFVVQDEDNAGLAMIDLDEPGGLVLGSDAEFVVSNVTGDINYGGLWIKGVIAGNGNDLKKSGPGRLTIAATNSTALGKLQCEEGVLAVTKPLRVESITKSGTLWVKVCETAVENVRTSALASNGKVNPNLCLFVETNGVEAVWYGGVVSVSKPTPASVKIYLPDAEGAIRFAERKWSACDAATADVLRLSDGGYTYKVQIPRAVASSGGKEYDTAEEAVRAATSEAPVKFAESPTIDNATHTITPRGGEPIAVREYYDIALEADNVVTFALNELAVPKVAEDETLGIPAFEVGVGGTETVGVGTITKVGLYYTLMVGTCLEDLAIPDGAKWVTGDGGVIQITAPKPSPDAKSGFYRVSVTDVAK